MGSNLPGGQSWGVCNTPRLSSRLFTYFFFYLALKIPGILKAFNASMGSSMSSAGVEDVERAYVEVCGSTSVIEWNKVVSVGAQQMLAGLVANEVWKEDEYMSPPLPESPLKMMGTTACVDMEVESDEDENVGNGPARGSEDQVKPLDFKSPTGGHSLPGGQSTILLESGQGDVITKVSAAVTPASSGAAENLNPDGLELAADDASEDDDESDAVEKWKVFGPTHGTVQSHDKHSDVVQFRQKDGTWIELTPKNISKPAMRAFKSKTLLDDVVETWSSVMMGSKDGVEFIKTITHTDAKHILNTQLRLEQAKRVGTDEAYTSMFFARIDGGGLPPVTGTDVRLSHPYMIRKMERFLDGKHQCFFVPGGSPRLSGDRVEVGVGTVPGGQTGFGVYAKHAFKMPMRDDEEKFSEMEDDFLCTMPFVGYPLCERKMQATNLTVEGLLAVTSKSENGGLRSIQKDEQFPGVLFVSHGGSLATLVNAGGQCSKMEIVSAVERDALSNMKKIKMTEIEFDENLLGFFKKHPAIANCLMKSMLLKRGKGGGRRKEGKKPSVSVGGANFVGAKVPCFFMCPKEGETFCKGEELFADYTVGSENLSVLDVQDRRFTGQFKTACVAPVATNNVKMSAVDMNINQNLEVDGSLDQGTHAVEIGVDRPKKQAKKAPKDMADGINRQLESDGSSDSSGPLDLPDQGTSPVDTESEGGADDQPDQETIAADTGPPKKKGKPRRSFDTGLKLPEQETPAVDSGLDRPKKKAKN